MDIRSALGVTLLLVFPASTGVAQEGGQQALAKQLANPVSDLISVPFQFNLDNGLGDGDGSQLLLNIQPVLPFSLNADWNLISRTVVPYVRRWDLGTGADDASGFGNVTQSFFFSPKAPTPAGLIWGAGPVIQLPTGQDGIAPGQWGAGVTAVAAIQQGARTGGMLANHVWSLTDPDDTGETSVTLLQPFLSHTTAGGTTFTLQSETTYNWEDDQWTVPINFVVSHIVNPRGQPLQLQGGLRYWANSPEGGPDGWGLRFAVTFLVPKG